MTQRIKQSNVWEVMQRKGINGVAVPFSLAYVKKSTGEMVDVPRCTCTSMHGKGATVNVLMDNEDKPKTIRKCLIIAINGAKIYL